MQMQPKMGKIWYLFLEAMLILDSFQGSSYALPQQAAGAAILSTALSSGTTTTLATQIPAGNQASTKTPGTTGVSDMGLLSSKTRNVQVDQKLSDVLYRA